MTYAVSKSEIASKILSSHIFEPDVAYSVEEFTTATRTLSDYDMQQYRISSESTVASMRFREALRHVWKEGDIYLIGLQKRGSDGGRASGLQKLPESDMQVEIGDYAIVLLRGENERKAREIFGTTEGLL